MPWKDPVILADVYHQKSTPSASRLWSMVPSMLASTTCRSAPGTDLRSLSDRTTAISSMRNSTRKDFLLLFASHYSSSLSRFLAFDGTSCRLILSIPHGRCREFSIVNCTSPNSCVIIVPSSNTLTILLPLGY